MSIKRLLSSNFVSFVGGFRKNVEGGPPKTVGTGVYPLEILKKGPGFKDFEHLMIGSKGKQ